jgi:hypothetical protein
LLEARGVLWGESVFAKPTPAEIIGFPVPGFGGFVFAFEAIHFCENFGGALVWEAAEHREEVFFFVRGVVRSRLSKIAESIFEGTAMFGIERTARGLRSHGPHCVEEAFDAAVTVREKSNRVRKGVLLSANGDRHRFLFLAYIGWLIGETLRVRDEVKFNGTGGSFRSRRSTGVNVNQRKFLQPDIATPSAPQRLTRHVSAGIPTLLSILFGHRCPSARTARPYYPAVARNTKIRETSLASEDCFSSSV